MSTEVHYHSNYIAWQYPNLHPYFLYMVNKYQPLSEKYKKVGMMLHERLNYLYSINASWEDQQYVQNQIDKAYNYSFEIEQEFVWSDDEEEVDWRDDPPINHIFKSEIQFYSIDIEELCREAFKPERLMYQLSFDPNYDE